MGDETKERGRGTQKSWTGKRHKKRGVDKLGQKLGGSKSLERGLPPQGSGSCLSQEQSTTDEPAKQGEMSGKKKTFFR